jgi:hypothetical protein
MAGWQTGQFINAPARSFWYNDIVAASKLHFWSQISFRSQLRGIRLYIFNPKHRQTRAGGEIMTASWRILSKF